MHFLIGYVICSVLEATGVPASNLGSLDALLATTTIPVNPTRFTNNTTDYNHNLSYRKGFILNQAFRFLTRTTISTLNIFILNT